MNKSNILILLFFLMAVIAYHLFGYIGHYGYDDLHYAKLAVDYNRGIFDENDHFSYRTPILVLTSLSYLLFGVSDFASSFPPLLITAAIILIVYSVLRKKGTVNLAAGLALATFSNWFIFYSDKLMPDVYVALSVLLSLVIIHRYKFSGHRDKPFLNAVLLSLSLLFGFMAKGTIVLFLPVLVFLALGDFWFRRDLKFWIYTAVAGTVTFAVYFLAVGLLTGDAFKRFEAIANNSYLNLCSYEEQPVEILLKRIAWQFFGLLVSQAMATGFIFLIAFFGRPKSISVFRMNDSFSFWAASAIILLLSSNFMTISFASYSPMCLDPRHFLYLIPVVSIPASEIVARFIKNKAFKVPLLATALLVTSVSFFQEGDSFLFHYLPLSIVLLIGLFLRAGKVSQSLFAMLFVAVMMLKPLKMVEYAQNVNYRTQRDIFREYVLMGSDSCTVITNDVQKRLGNYYNRFDTTGRIRFVNYREFSNDSADTRRKILFMNWYTRYLSGMSQEDLPYYARHMSERNNLIYKNDELLIEIYEMNEILIPADSFTKLFESENNFEAPVPGWSQNSEDITADIRFEGDYSNQVAEFSSTFRYELDSLQLDGISEVVLRCSLYGYFEDRTDAKIVVAVENQEGSYIWYGLEINKYIKAYSNWWPVEHEVTIKTEDIKSNSRLGVFVWNMKKENVHIDNFQIIISGRQ